MKPTALALATSLLVAPALTPAAPAAAGDAARPGGAALLAQAEQPAPATPPESVPPPQAAPPPAGAPAPAPQGAAPTQPRTAAPGGQWVYTQQYGWIWMPYGDAYTYLPPEGYGEPQMYVYEPVVGWTWVVAPWVWGWGPWPYFGIYGPGRFAWYGHGWWRSPYRWHFGPRPFGPYFAGRFGHGFAPAPPRLHAPGAVGGWRGGGARVGRSGRR